MGLFQKNAEVEVRAVCDVYGRRIDDAQKKAPGAKPFYEHLKLLELKEIDVVLIGSPDHWHKNHAVDAMNAGKDVYVEKPLCRLREEGLEIVRAARATGRICQVGLQQRSGQVYIEARDKFFRSDAVGRVLHVDAGWDGGVAQRRRPAEPLMGKPSNLDWIRFLGPAAYREWNPTMYFNFRAFLEFNGGRLTDFGHHWMDVVHMFLERDDVQSASASGGIYFENTQGRTAPDSVSALFEYPGFTVYFHSLAMGNPPEYGVTFYGEKGKLYVNRNRYEFTEAAKDAVPVVQKFPGDITADHVRNFLDCVKSRRLPNADAYIAYKSVVPPLLAVQSYVENRKIHYDPARELVRPA